MKSGKLCLIHTYYIFLDLVRQPIWLTTTLIFPSMFFWFFGVPNADTAEKSRLLMGSFSAFAVLGVVVFQFAATIAEDRARPWHDYLRTLRTPAWVLIASRMLCGIIFSGMAVVLVIVTAYTFTPVTVPLDAWKVFFAGLFFGAIPFCFLGTWVGLVCSPKSAVPVANLLYLPLSFAGGLWMPPNALPKVVQNLSPYLPTRLYGELVWKALFNQDIPWETTGGLVGYSIVFSIFTFASWRRQEVSRFH